MKGKVLGKAKELVLTEQQYQTLGSCTTGRGGYQSLCQRIHDSVTTINGQRVAEVYEADLERMIKAATRTDHGTWQDLCREILAANP